MKGRQMTRIQGISCLYVVKSYLNMMVKSMIKPLMVEDIQTIAAVQS